MSECIKVKTNKYSFRNAPPYPANKCKSIKKKGNDDELYLSQPDKKGTYKWVRVNKNHTRKNKRGKEDLQMLAKKYEVTKTGSNQDIADRLVRLRGHFIKNKKDRKIIEQFLKRTTPSAKRWEFSPLKV